MTDPTPILGTNLASAIVPFTDADQFPTHHATYGKGGWRGVATLVDRDAIPTPRLEDGMVVYVVENQTAYVYIDPDWLPLVTGSGGGQTFTRLYYTHTIADLPSGSTSAFELPFGKTSMILRLSVSRPVQVTVWSTPDHSDTNPYTFLATSDHLIDDGSIRLSDNSVIRQRNYSIFANLETPVLEKVYAEIESVDANAGPVTLNVTYIVIETGQGTMPGTGINVQLNDTAYDSSIGTLDFVGDNWTLQNSSNGLPQGTVSIAVAGGAPAPMNYVIPVTFTYSPGSDEVLRFHTFVEPITFGSDFQGSAGYVEVAPTQTYVMDVYKNGNQIGTITVNTDKSFVFQTFELVTFGIGDTIKVVAPHTADNSVSNLSVSLLGALGPGATSANYIVPMSFTFSPVANEVLLFHTFVETVNFVADFNGSVGAVDVAPTSAFTLGVYKNGVSIGTVVINTDNSFVFSSSATPVSFGIGDTLKVVGPSITDAAITNVSISFLGTRV